MDIYFVELDLNESPEIYEMAQEIGEGENGFVNNFNVESLEQFRKQLRRNYDISRSIGLQEGYVPQTIYWLYIGNKAVGYGKLRHYLNDNLKVHGGHIGYVIRPTERGKGYGKIMLKELLKKAQEKGITEVLLTCEQANIPSRKIIEDNGGELQETNQGSCKYWVNIEVQEG